MALASLRDGDPARIGRFRLTARLGAGGMGVVYLGEARDCGPVAIKVVRPEVGDDPEFRARFRREVALLARIQGLCTVRVIEADTESASPFLVTEYANGPSLAEQVKGGGPLGPDMVYGLATGLAEALVAIHAVGVVHRDLKPGNVLLTPQGPKVIDFGIAQTLDGTVLTQSGMTMGSPGFMAPEQVSGTPGQPSDIFAWGLTVAYAASGRPPFGTGPSEALLYRVLHDRPDIAAVPPSLRPLVEAALARDPGARPGARDLLAWLTAGVPAAQPNGQEHDGFAPTRQVLARTWQPYAPGPDGPAAVRPSRHRRSGRRPARRHPVAVLAGASVLAVIVGVGTAYTLESGYPSGPAASGQTAASSATPAVTFGRYTGRQPAAIILNANEGGGTIEDIQWTSWAAGGAAGVGTLDLAVTQVQLSGLKDGRYTRIEEVTSGQATLQSRADDWPAGASSAATAACTKPTPAQLLAAWRAAPARVQKSQAAPDSVTGFGLVQCWQDWIVAQATGQGDGSLIFSRAGGLHPIPGSQLLQFTNAVCDAPDAPMAWKDVNTGPASC